MASGEHKLSQEGKLGRGPGEPDNGRSLLTRHLQSTLADQQWQRLRQRFVVPRLLALPPQLTSAPGSFDLVKAAEELVDSLVGSAGLSSTPDVDVAETLKGSTQLLLLGDVGAGKTALLQAVTLDYAGYCLSQDDADLAQYALCEEKRFPIYVDLREFEEESVEDHLAAQFRRYHHEGETEVPVARLLVTQPFLFLFDHLDRVSPHRQLEVISALSDFICEKHPQHRYVIACRAHDYPLFQAWFKKARLLTLKPLNDDEIAHMASQRLGEVQAQAILQRLNAEEGFWDLARSPRILQAFCSLASEAESPLDSPAQLLEGLVGLLLLEAGVSVEEVDRRDPVGCLYPTLGRMAVEMQKQGLQRMDRPAFHQLLDSVLSPRARTPSARQLANQLVDAALLQSDAERTWLAFRSPLLQTFFSACFIAEGLEQGKPLESLIPPARWPEWEASLTLLPGLTEPEKVLRALIAQGPEDRTVLLAARCALHLEQPYATLARLAPLDAQLHLSYGQAFRQLGYPAQARLALESALKLKPNQAVVHLQLAEVLREQGEHVAAAEQYERAASLGSDPIACRLGIALSHLAQGMTAEASTDIEQARTALEESQARAHHVNGHFARAEGRLAEALEEFEAAARLWTTPHHLCHVASVQRQLGDLEAAQSNLRHALDIEPEAGEVWMELGLLHEAHGVLHKAMEAFSQAIRWQPRAALPRVHRGRVYGRLNQPVRASAELKHALQLDPNCGLAYAELGVLTQNRGRYSEALSHYRRAIQCEPREASYHRQMGWLLKLMGRPEEAETELELAVRLEHGNPEHRNRLGSVLADQGRYREALASYAEAAALAPDEPLYRHNMGAMYSRLGQVDEAERLLLEALRLCSRLGAEQPDGELPLEVAMVAAEAHSELGYLRYAQGRYEDALQHFQRSSQLVPFADTYLARQAEVYRRLGQHEAAARALSQATNLSPEDPSLQAELGLTYRAAGRLDEACAAFRCAVELNPHDATYRYYLGSAELARGRVDNAGEHLAHALELREDYPDASHELARAYLQKGLFDRALETCRRAVELQPDEPSYRATLGWCLLEAGELEDASQELEKSIALNPDLPEAHFQIARLREAEGRLEEALVAAEKAVHLDGRDARYPTLAGMLRLLLGQPNEAAAWLRLAAELNPESSQAQEHLAVAAERAGDYELAAKAYGKAVTLKPSAFVFERLGRALAALERWQPAADALQRALDLVPASATAVGYLGMCLWRLGEHQQALQHLQRAIAMLRDGAATSASAAQSDASESDTNTATHINGPLAPAWAAPLLKDPPPSEMEGLFCVEAALLHLDCGRPADALALLELATSLVPGRACWWNLRGEAYRRQERLSEAKEAFVRAAQLDRTEGEYHRNIGFAASRLGQYEEAKTAYERALALADRPNWRAELGEILFEAGEFEHALLEYERAAALEPDNPVHWHGQGRALIGLSRYAEAEAVLARTVRESAAAADWRPIYDLGRALDGMGKLEEAFQQYRAALALAPDQPSNHLALASVHRRRLAAKETRRAARDTVLSTSDYRAAEEHLRRALAIQPGFAPAHDELGLLLGAAGDDELALAHHLQAMALDPHQVSYRCHAADARLRLGQPREALSLCLQATADGQRQPELLLRLGQAHEMLEDWSAALSAYEEAAIRAPSDPRYLHPLGKARLRLGHDRAYADLEQAVRLRPDLPDWHHDLGLAYAARRRWQDALREFRVAVEAKPGHAEYHRSIAQALGALRRDEEALRAAREAVRLAPNEAAGHAVLGRLLQQIGSFDEALRCFERSCRLEPGETAYEVQRAIVLGLMGDREQAERELRRIVAEDPSYAPPYFELALSLERQGQLVEALEVARRAAELDPRSPVHLHTAARLYRRLGYLDEAARHLRQALEITTEDSQVFYELGQLAEARGDDQRALAAYQRALELEPRAEYYSQAAVVLAKRGRLADAVASLEAALAREPDQAEWRNRLGELFESQGNSAAAQQEYRRALKLDPRNPVYHRNLGVLLKRLARYDEAVEELQTALQLNPEYTDAYRHLTSASASALLQRNLRGRSS